MVMIMNQWCSECERETSHRNGKCVFCIERKRREYLAKWNAQTVDEKLIDLRKRVEKLERGPIRYG